MEIDEYDDRTEVWECPTPALGAQYRVLEDEWDMSSEKPVRVIKRIELGAVSVSR